LSAADRTALFKLIGLSRQNPHETRRAMGDLMLDNLDAFFAGKAMPTPVV